jgi:DHA1 family chloramphenicol resistance protein-like MFS transporter
MMLAGLLPELSRDLAVGIPQAGLLISAFALGMLVGAPVLAVLTLRWRRR